MRLDVTEVSSGYGDLTVLRDISITVERGEIVAILGHNGVGKTTLLRTLIGLLRTRSGFITVDGDDITSSPPHAIAKRGVAYIPQEAALFADLSVAENLRVVKRKKNEFKEAVAYVVELFPFLRDRLQQRAGTLSGGEQKMLLVARALMTSPRLILSDEITEGVQPMQVDRIRETLRQVNQSSGATIVLVEQHLDFALSLASRYCVMKQGCLVSTGSSDSSEVRSQVTKQMEL